MDPAYRRRKLWLWGIRQVLTAVLAFLFWEHWWMRWLVAVAVVLALFNLGMLLFGGPYLQRRLQRARTRMAELQAEEQEDTEHTDQ
jgi:ABC-type bacteriocin/lantibiotic exporter with double-glycine peptidase domain